VSLRKLDDAELEVVTGGKGPFQQDPGTGGGGAAGDKCNCSSGCCGSGFSNQTSGAKIAYWQD
jgi:hypothetical protein